MLIQLLLGGVAGAAVILKIGWHRFRSLFGASADTERQPGADD
jgi:hypothetical protein